MALFVQGLRLFCSGASPLRPCQAYPRALSWLGFVAYAFLFCSGASPLRPCQAYPRALSWLGFVAYALETVGGWALPILSAQRHLAPDPLNGLCLG